MPVSIGVEPTFERSALPLASAAMICAPDATAVVSIPTPAGRALAHPPDARM
jgi:hypothetical protein